MSWRLSHRHLQGFHSPTTPFAILKVQPCWSKRQGAAGLCCAREQWLSAESEQSHCTTTGEARRIEKHDHPALNKVSPYCHEHCHESNSGLIWRRLDAMVMMSVSGIAPNPAGFGRKSGGELSASGGGAPGPSVYSSDQRHLLWPF